MAPNLECPSFGYHSLPMRTCLSKDRGIGRGKQDLTNTAHYMHQSVFDEGHAGHVRRH
jgi:hypothetical protein